MLFSGCCAVSVVPELPEKNRSRPERGSFGAEALRRDPEPHPPRRAQLRHLLEQVQRRREVERQPRSEPVEVHPASEERVRVRDRRRHRERQLLHGVAPGLPGVVARDRDRVEARQVGGGELDHVARQPHRGLGREDVGLARQELLQDVVLERAGEPFVADPLTLGRDQVGGEDDRRRGVDREVHRHAAQIEPVEQVGHVVRGVDRHAHAPDLRLRTRPPRSRSPAASAGRTPPTARSALARAGTGSGRSSLRPTRSRRTAASSRAGPGTSTGTGPRVNGGSPGRPSRPSSPSATSPAT